MAGKTNYARMFLTLGVPIIIGVVLFAMLHSVLYALLGLVGAFVVIIAIVAKLNPAHASSKLGTRAWEAKMNNDLLIKVIAQRTQEAKAVADLAKLARCTREIEFLAKQVEVNDAIIVANDASPGRGYIGFDAYNEE